MPDCHHTDKLEKAACDHQRRLAAHMKGIERMQADRTQYLVCDSNLTLLVGAMTDPRTRGGIRERLGTAKFNALSEDIIDCYATLTRFIDREQAIAGELTELLSATLDTVGEGAESVRSTLQSVVDAERELQV